jgi:hypothetical protein
LLIAGISIRNADEEQALEDMPDAREIGAQQ